MTRKEQKERRATIEEALRTTSLTYQQIAAKHGVGMDLVSLVVWQTGIGDERREARRARDAEIVKLAKQDTKRSDICETLGVTPGLVSKALRMADCGPRAIRAKRDAEIVAAIQAGADIDEVARTHGSNRYRIRRACERAGVGKPFKARVAGHTRTMAILAALLREPLPDSEAAREFGVSRARVSQIRIAAADAGIQLCTA